MIRSCLPLIVVMLAGCASATKTAPVPDTSPADAPEIGDAGASGDNGTPAEVERIIDGDSLELRTDGQVEETRLIGINTPEGDECLGDAASDRLAELLAAGSITVAADGRDEFGRLLAVVRVDGADVNLTLVADGLAVARDQSGHGDAALYETAEVQARDDELGIWEPGACGGPTDVAVEIVHVEADAPGPDPQNPNGEWVEIFNNGPAVDLGGWVVRDESTRHRYEFPGGFVLEGGASLRLFSGRGDETAAERYWGKEDGSVWNNDGDTAFLQDATGSNIAVLSY